MFSGRATGNSRFEMTKFPPPANGKIPENSRFPNWQFLWVYTAQKSYQTSLRAYIANVNDVEESLRPILESRREWNRSMSWLPDQILLCLILFVLCAPGECSSWEYLGLLGPISFLIYMDDIQHCTIVTVDFTYLLMTLMYLFLLVVKQYQTIAT